MHLLDFWFDPISPYAALAFEQLPEALAGLSVGVTYRPVLFAGLLKHWGQLGPAEVAPKRVWTYRQVAWLARAQGSELVMPAVHPFNPLPLLRLAWAAATPSEAPLSLASPNRRVVQAVLEHVWHGGADPLDPKRLAELSERVAPTRDPQGDEVKATLRAQGEAALACGVFGVPTISLGDEHFWGLDSLALLRARLQGDAWFETPAWRDAPQVPIGKSRKRAS